MRPDPMTSVHMSLRRSCRAWGGLVTSALIAAAAAVPASAQQTRIGVLVGEVVDERTLAPVRAAAVTLTTTSHSVATDSLGRFRMQGLLAGRYTLHVRHVAYGAHEVEINVQAGVPTELRLVISQQAIALSGLMADVLSAEQLRARGAGFRRGIVTRQQIARAEGTNMTLPDVLRAHVPTVRVRRLERVVGAPVCIELRTIRSTQDGDCLSPAVYLDGAPINDPTSLYGALDLRVIESMEVIPANEAGVRFGTGALYGALLIETRRPGAARGERQVERRDLFDWSDDPQGHRTGRVLLLSVTGNVVGLAVGVTAARGCLRLRAPSYDGLVSDCAPFPTIGLAVAALTLPALGSGLASQWAGRTEISQGRLMATSVGAAMTLVPGYALVMTGRRNDSPGLQSIGYGLLFVGAPLMSTAADYLFRTLRRVDQHPNHEP